MTVNDILLWGLVVLVLSWIILGYKIVQYKMKLDQKSLKLINLYLDIRFIARNLSENLYASDRQIFCDEMIGRIKEYYQLEEILLINSINNIKKELMQDNKNYPSTRAKILDIINSNLPFIQNQLAADNLETGKSGAGNFIKQSAHIDKVKCDLYIFSLSPTSVKNLANDGVIICVKRSCATVNTLEIETLEANINFLRYLINQIGLISG